MNRYSGSSSIGPQWRLNAFFVPLLDSWRTVLVSPWAQAWAVFSAVITYAIRDLFTPIFILLSIAMLFAWRASRRADLFDAANVEDATQRAHAMQNVEMRAGNLLSANISMLGMLMVFRAVEYWADTQGLLGVLGVIDLRSGAISTVAVAVSLWQVFVNWRTALRRLGQDVPFWPLIETTRDAIGERLKSLTRPK